MGRANNWAVSPRFRLQMHKICAGGATKAMPRGFVTPSNRVTEFPMNGIIYLVGLVVVILAILSFFGLR